jgi:hypothetical protein
MNMFLAAALVATASGLTGCLTTTPTVGGGSESRMVATSPSDAAPGAADGTTTREEVGIKKCAKPMGTAVLLDAYSTNDEDPYGIAATMAAQRQMMNQVFGFSDPVPLMKVIMQESRCFKLLHEKAREKADYLIEVEIPLPEQTTASGAGGAAYVGSFFGMVGAAAGALFGNVSKKEVQVILNVTKSQTDELTVFTGQSSAISLGGGLGGVGFSGGGVLGGAMKSPKGEAAVAAMIHAHNQIPGHGL